jgi:hypothetical protein
MHRYIVSERYDRQYPENEYDISKDFEHAWSVYVSCFLSKKDIISLMKFSGIESNLWKYFLIQFTIRRNFIPILSVYFLTLPDTRANQIGLFTGIGYTAALLMQMPSGYIADHW